MTSLAVAFSPAFLGSCAAVVCSPGPDTFLIVRLVSRARRRAPVLAAAAGMLLAGAGYAALAVGGFSVLASRHPAIFLTWRVAGALFLLTIGLRALRDAARPPAAGSPAAGSPAGSPAPTSPGPGAGAPVTMAAPVTIAGSLTAARSATRAGSLTSAGSARRVPRHFLLGFLSTASNPKVVLFLTAFLPQFLPSARPAPAALALLALVYLCIGGLWLLVVTEAGVRIVGARTDDTVAGFPAWAARTGNTAAGLVLVALAVILLIHR